MNKQRLEQLARAVETDALPIGFNMNYYFHDNEHDYNGEFCATVACLAGWCLALAKGFETEKEALDFINNAVEYDKALQRFASDWLGIDYQVGRALFLPPIELEWENITAEQAVGVVRNLAKTGVVDWSGVETEGF